MPEREALVLFDIDGTLLRGAGPHHRQALEAGIFAHTQLRATTDGIDTAGTLDYDLIRLMLQSANVTPELAETQVAPIAIECEAAYLTHCATDLRPFLCPGVVPLLQTLKAAGVTVGVVTGNLQVIGWKKLELAGLRNYFATGAFSQDGTTRAALARTAEERARTLRHLPAFRSVTLIGDHRNDVIAARSNGYRSIAVATGVLGADQLRNEGADLVAGTMAELSLADVLG